MTIYHCVPIRQQQEYDEPMTKRRPSLEFCHCFGKWQPEEAASPAKSFES